jgi:hypothetical protein
MPMSASWLFALPHAESTTVSVCQCLPGYLLASGRTDVARDILLELASHARDGFVLDRLTQGAPDVPATLWFARAAFLYRRACSGTNVWHERLLPAVKKAVQTLISGGPSAFRMDDGGLLAPGGAIPVASSTDSVPSAANAVCPIGINAMWYFTLAMLAEELHAIKDPVGDHYERLSGRFRRSFAKCFWCSAHGFLCDPELQKDPDHATAHAIPDPEQLLIAMLPFSPIPRTKQRQIVLFLRDKSLAPRGVLMPATSRDGGLYGASTVEPIASSLHLAWLIESLIGTSDTPDRAAAECRPLLPPPGPVARFYVGLVPADIPQNVPAYAPSTAEMTCARQLCGM